MPDSRIRSSSEGEPTISIFPELQLEAFKGIIAARQFGLKSAMILNGGAIGLFFTFVGTMKMKLDSFALAGFIALLIGAAMALLETVEVSDDLLRFMIATEEKRYVILNEGERKYRWIILASYLGFAIGGMLAATSTLGHLIK